MTSKETQRKITELTWTLDKLFIQQQENSREIEKTLRVTADWYHKKARKQTQEEANEGSGFHNSDHVNERNPSKGQINKGEVIGKTKDNLIKI